MDTQFGDWATLASIISGALAGGFVNGLTGFGTGLTALPIWLYALEPVVAAQLVSAASIAGHISTVSAIWRDIKWRRLFPMVGAGLLGVPIGTWLLPLISVSTFRFAVGIVLTLYCTLMLFAAGRVHVAGGGKGAEAVIGFGGGVLGGMAGLSGAMLTVWAALKGWPKEQRRVFFQAFNMLILSAMLLTSFMRGLVGVQLLLALAVGLPGTLAGAWLGIRVYRRLDDYRFDRIVLFLLLLSGLSLVWFNR
jgi:uncharacterized membrane protein YfcA